MKEEMRTIGYLCPRCRKPVMQQRSRFALAASGAIVQCECGKSELQIDFDGEKFRISVPCGVCGGEHLAECGADRLLDGEGIGLACPETSELCCFIGEEYAVERALDGVLLPNEAAQLGGLGAGEADALAVEQPVRAALRQMLAAAHAAGHADAEFFAVEVDLQLALAAFALHDRARGGKGEAGALLHNGLSAPRAQVADGAHFFFHIVSSRKKFIFVSIIHRHKEKANPFSLRGVQDGTVF